MKRNCKFDNKQARWVDSPPLPNIPRVYYKYDLKGIIFEISLKNSVLEFSPIRYTISTF